MISFLLFSIWCSLLLFRWSQNQFDLLSFFLGLFIALSKNFYFINSPNLKNLYKRKGEIYGLNHQLLNIENQTMWLNFGYWDQKMIQEMENIQSSSNGSNFVSDLETKI